MNTYRKKLIEVDLPLDDINREAAREKSIRHGHPSTLHMWWARRPLAACRAIIFASMVDDPSTCDEFCTPEAQAEERERLHNIIRRLVVWQNSNDEKLLSEARYEIVRSVARNNGKEAPTEPDAVLAYLHKYCPAIYDPFCGGGSIPLEAQRLGLHALASDLNPLPVLINKAMIELPPQFHNQKPVNPDADPLGVFIGSGKKKGRIPWRGPAGLADDIRYYGAWMRKEAYKCIGSLYPKARLSDSSEATVIAWLWMCTVPCANPVCRIHMPLTKTFQLSKKKGNEHWTKPIVDRASNTISFVVQNHQSGLPKKGTINRSGAFCIACGNAVKLSYVREQVKAGNMGEIMTAIVAQAKQGRLFLTPTDEHIQGAMSATPNWHALWKTTRSSYEFKDPGVWNYPLASTFHQTAVDRIDYLQ